MASSSKYDVFISFRGEDTRDSLTSHLYDALSQRKIHTFIDDRLERGDEISPNFRKAIKDSKISVISFSENYASSTWCLDELVHILECKKKHGQIVIPIFYRVDPSDVRKQEGKYAAAFAKHEKHFGFENRMDKVHQWKAALEQVANMSGWNSLITRTESKLVGVIVHDIVKKLNFKFSISNVKGLVGLEKHIKGIESLLCIDSPRIGVIGIWGMGGIGRIIVTTRDKQVLSRVIDKIYNIQGLNYDEAYKLFCSKAFKEKSSISDDYSTLSKRVICYAQGVPLALTVLGSFLYSMSKEEWESTLEKLKVTPSMDIQNVLRISYNGLDDNEKDMFLDIACFFTGHQSPAFVESILDACGFFTRIGLWILHDKSLICMSGYNLWMHHLLREMGRQGTATVEGIFLHNCGTIKVNLSPEVFSEMRSLRLLKIYGFDKKNKCNLKFPQDVQYLPDALASIGMDAL
ncbi:disease resistance protein RPV1-like [Ziziphus jujuba]|uniref:Disease resistance protein RPV1-like n=1 Tax=Ziziphus jujuba TaxID=326968 RepID=A0ABM3ZUP0_ZIZJJ|nr:disease resistance protein RPV1-like [Ziziphus jujuba]